MAALAKYQLADFCSFVPELLTHNNRKRNPSHNSKIPMLLLHTVTIHLS